MELERVEGGGGMEDETKTLNPVTYTHLTLPTKTKVSTSVCSVVILISMSSSTPNKPY